MGVPTPPTSRHGSAARGARGPANRSVHRGDPGPHGAARGETPRPLPRRGRPAQSLHVRWVGPAGYGTGPDEPEAPPAPTRNEPVATEAYASELPDLSGPVPRPPQRKPPRRTPASEPPTRPAAPTSRVQVGTHPRGPVRASMQIRRIDPWSALKVSLVLSVALFFVWMIAVAFLYLVLGGMGVWSKLNSNVGDLLTSASGSSGGELVSSGTIFGGATLIGLVNIVLLTRDGDHRGVHLQPDHRPRRRSRGDAGRPGLSRAVWGAASRLR